MEKGRRQPNRQIDRKIYNMKTIDKCVRRELDNKIKGADKQTGGEEW
jgi:hypothetical protein